MSFDKAAYWAQKGKPRAKGRMANFVCCAACKGTVGTAYGTSFDCARGCSPQKQQEALAADVMKLAKPQEAK